MICTAHVRGWIEAMLYMRSNCQGMAVDPDHSSAVLCSQRWSSSFWASLPMTTSTFLPFFMTKNVGLYLTPCIAETDGGRSIATWPHMAAHGYMAALLRACCVGHDFVHMPLHTRNQACAFMALFCTSICHHSQHSHRHTLHALSLGCCMIGNTTAQQGTP